MKLFMNHTKLLDKPSIFRSLILFYSYITIFCSTQKDIQTLCYFFLKHIVQSNTVTWKVDFVYLCI